MLYEVYFKDGSRNILNKQELDKELEMETVDYYRDLIW